MSATDDDRFEEFRAALADLGAVEPRPQRDARLGLLGAALMVGGVALGVYAYFGLSTSTSNPLQQRDAIVVALIGVSVSVVGTGVWLRASFAAFLRLWLARLVLEQRRTADGPET